MKNSKFFLAVIVGTVVSFLLGWLIYGILLKTAMAENCGLAKDIQDKVFKPMEGQPAPMDMVVMLLSNFFGAVFLTVIAGWANARTLAAGAKVGAITGVLISLNYGLLWLGMSYIYTPTGLAIDTCAGTVMTAITTAIIAMILGKGTTN